jgi:ABC-type transport system involved in Fe-S cluster assembly fused permease/ATPase subunit
MIMGLCFSWRLTLWSLIFIPFLCLGINLSSKYAPNAIIPKTKAKDAENSADILASDSIQNHKTISSFASDDIMIDEYQRHLDTAKVDFLSSAKIGGFFFGFS